MTDVNGLGPGYGGTLAAPIWRQFMEAASDGYCGRLPHADRVLARQVVLRSALNQRFAIGRADVDLHLAVHRHVVNINERRRGGRNLARDHAGDDGPGHHPSQPRPQPRPARHLRRAVGRESAHTRHGAARMWTSRHRIAAMPKEEKVELEGEVVEALPNAMFRVKLDNMDRVVLGHVAGKMRRFRIRILPGDRVRVELSPYDLDRARIVYRHR